MRGRGDCWRSLSKALGASGPRHDQIAAQNKDHGQQNEREHDSRDDRKQLIGLQPSPQCLDHLFSDLDLAAVLRANYQTADSLSHRHFINKQSCGVALFSAALCFRE
jgi:hypothetical protein